MTVAPEPRAAGRETKRCLLVALAAVAWSLAAAMGLSAAAVGLGTVVADGWDEIGAMFVAGLLLFPLWCWVSVRGLRWACRRWLRTDPGPVRLTGAAVASALAGTGVAWLAAAGALPAGDWGPVLYGPAAAVATLAALLSALTRGARETAGAL